MSGCSHTSLALLASGCSRLDMLAPMLYGGVELNRLESWCFLVVTHLGACVLYHGSLFWHRHKNAINYCRQQWKGSFQVKTCGADTLGSQQVWAPCFSLMK